MKRRTWVRWIFLGIGAIVLLVLLVATYQVLRPVRLEKLSLSDLSGVSVNLDSLFQDKHTILNFWATWCKPCIAEMPMLDSVHQLLDKDKWQLLLISDEPVERIAEFMSKRPFTLPVLRSTQGLASMGVAALPKTLIVDEEMQVLYKKTGELTMRAEEMLEIVRKVE